MLNVALRDPFLNQFFAALLLQGCDQGLQCRVVRGLGQRLEVFAFTGCIHQPLGRKDACTTGNNGPLHAQIVCQGADVKTAGTAKTEQGKIRWIEAFLNGNHP